MLLNEHVVDAREFPLRSLLLLGPFLIKTTFSLFTTELTGLDDKFKQAIEREKLEVVPYEVDLGVDHFTAGLTLPFTFMWPVSQSHHYFHLHMRLLFCR